MDPMVINSTTNNRDRLASAIDCRSQKTLRKQRMKFNMKFTTQPKSRSFTNIPILINQESSRLVGQGKASMPSSQASKPLKAGDRPLAGNHLSILAGDTEILEDRSPSWQEMVTPRSWCQHFHLSRKWLNHSLHAGQLSLRKDHLDLSPSLPVHGTRGTRGRSVETMYQLVGTRSSTHTLIKDCLFKFVCRPW